MGSVSYDQAAQLSRCHVLPSLFDSLVTDNFLRLLPIQLVDGDCVSYPLIEDADKPGSIAYVTSGGPISTGSVNYGADADLSLKRIVARSVVSGDIATNVSQVHDVMKDQSLALAQLLVERVGQVLWSEATVSGAPPGMVTFASQNPAGEALPVQGLGKPLKMPEDLLCLLGRQSPWNPSSRRYFVMNSRIYHQILGQAWASGTPLLDYRPDAATGETMAHFADVPLVACDHISLSELEPGTTSVYLVRVGQAASDPQKIAGVSLLTSSAWPGVEVGQERSNDGLADEYFAEVSWNVAFANGSRSSVVRGKGYAV